MENYITIRQAATILGVSDSTIRNFLMKYHYFDGKRFGRQLRIDKESFDRFINQANIR